MTTSINPRLLHYRRFTRWASLGAITIGSLVLIGWLLNIALLANLGLGLTPMRPNTALLFVLSGVSLWLLRQPPDQTEPRALWGGRLCSLVILAVALLTLSQDFAGWNLGIDDLLVRQSSLVSATANPLRMSPVTALNFIFVSLALLLIDQQAPQGGRPSQWLCLAVIILAGLVVIGYAYGVRSLYQIPSFSSIGLHTVLTFILLADGILCARPDQGLMARISSQNLSSLMLWRFSPISIIILFILGWLRLRGQDLGLYDTAFGVALIVVSSMVILNVLIWLNTGALNEAEGAIRQLNAELEERVQERTARLAAANQQLHAEISERRQIEAALAAERDLLHRLMDNIPDTIYFKDTASRFTRVNRAQARLLGLNEPEEAFGKTDFDFQPIELAQHFFEEEQHILTTGQPLVNRIEYNPTRDGQDRWLSATKVPLLDTNGKATGIVGISRDITERQQAEQKLRQYAEAVEQAKEEVQQFTSVVSHDLRTPLVNIKGFAGELRRALCILQPVIDAGLSNMAEAERGPALEAMQETIPEALNFIDMSVMKIDSLTNAVLQLSRLGHRELHYEAVNLNEIVKSTLATLSHRIEEAGIQVYVAELPTIIADRISIEQIFGNVLTNAVMYLDPARPGQIQVSAAEENKVVRVDIQDNGRGIAESERERVFQIFRRGGQADVPGEGIGLAFVQTIVRRHGGEIWFESQPGQGTTFSFTLSKQLEGKSDDD